MELDISFDEKVSTHSRAEAAAKHCPRIIEIGNVSTHSRAEAAAQAMTEGNHGTN